MHRLTARGGDASGRLRLRFGTLEEISPAGRASPSPAFQPTASQPRGPSTSPPFRPSLPIAPAARHAVRTGRERALFVGIGGRHRGRHRGRHLIGKGAHPGVMLVPALSSARLCHEAHRRSLSGCGRQQHGQRHAARPQGLLPGRHRLQPAGGAEQENRRSYRPVLDHHARHRHRARRAVCALADGPDRRRGEADAERPGAGDLRQKAGCGCRLRSGRGPRPAKHRRVCRGHGGHGGDP